MGMYTVTVLTGSASRKINLYAQTPLPESVPSIKEASFALTGDASDKSRDGVFEDLTFVFIILAVLFITDWMVYCYEQYQLR